MGGPLSPGLTSLDLDRCLHEWLGDAKKTLAFGWRARGTKARNHVFGTIFVDDILLCSNTVCPDCLFAGLRDALPCDIGISREFAAIGDCSFEYLHTKLRVLPQPRSYGMFDVSLLLPNLAFSMGTTLHQTVAKVPLYTCSFAQTKEDIRPYMLARTVMCENVLDGSLGSAAKQRHAVEFLICTIVETARLRWPVSWQAQVFVGYAFYRKSQFAHFVRKVGRRLRKDTDIALWFRCCEEFAPATEIWELVETMVEQCLASFM
jgi:hypothetical protein